MKHCKKNVSVLALLLTAILIFSACAASPQNSDGKTEEPIFYCVTVDGVPQNVLKGKTALEPPEPEKDGFNFLGWISEGEPFDFSVPIYKDTVVESRFEAISVNVPEAEDITPLYGKFGQSGSGCIALADGSIGIAEGKALLRGSFEVSLRGAGDHGVYFCLDQNGLMKNKPDGSWYALSIDKFGNIILTRTVNNSSFTAATSLAIKPDYREDVFYHFTVTVIGSSIRVLHGSVPIILYQENSPIVGTEIGFFAEKSGAEFEITNYSPATAVAIKDGTLYWSDSEKAEGYSVILLDGKEEALSGDARSFDLTTLQLEDSVLYEGCLDRIEADGHHTLLGKFEYAIETPAEGIDCYFGNWVDSAGRFLSKKGKSLALLKDTEFTDGSIEAQVTPGTPNDCGIVFRCDTNGSKAFWENVPAQYYCALINNEGWVILGKVNFNGNTWTCPADYKLSSYDPSQTYVLRVEAAGNNFKVYVNEHLCFDYTDPAPFTGSGVGFRATNAGTKISPLEITLPQPVALEIERENTSAVLGEEFDASRLSASLKYNNGVSEPVTITQEMLSGLDTQTTGRQEVTVSYFDAASGKTFEESAFITVTETDYLRYIDFSNYEDSSALPNNWAVQTGSTSSSSFFIENGKLCLTNTASAVGAAQYSGYGESDYTAEITFTVNSYVNTSRWFGLTVRLQESTGWYKGSIGIDGAGAINAWTNGDLSKGGWDNTNASTGHKTGITLEKVVEHTLKIAVRGQLAALWIDEIFVCSYSLPDKFDQGGVGIACSGLNAEVSVFSIRAPEDADFPSEEA